MQFLKPIYEPHYFQLETIEDVRNGVETNNSPLRRFKAGPTGTGKSICILYNQHHFGKHGFTITPRVEIIAGMLEKCGVKYNTYSEAVSIAEQNNIFTPIKFRNRLLAGDIKTNGVKLLQIDEGHHSTADTYDQIKLLLGDRISYVAYSASPYRATARGTKELRDFFGKPEWMITYKKAWEENYISLPTCETWPLIDDDLIEISNGEFVISKLVSATRDKLDYVFKQVIERGFTINHDGTNYMLEPTLISVPSSQIMPYIQRAAKDNNFNIVCITDETPFSQRINAFKLCLNNSAILCHIDTVGEGVDLPIRISIDLASTLSANKFVQRFGRNTRPIREGEISCPYYICTNRNLERHGYLLDGYLPSEVIKQSQESFVTPSNRIGMRAFGIESLGRLKGFNVRLTNGITITCYSVTQMDGHKRQEYFVICHPQYANPVWFNKQSTLTKKTEERTYYDYGKWVNVEPPTELTGFKSHSQNGLTTAQKDYWNKHARVRGIDPEQSCNHKTFQIVPVLVQTNNFLVDKG